MTSVLVGASSPAQIEQNIAAAAAPKLTPDELHSIDSIAPVG